MSTRLATFSLVVLPILVITGPSLAASPTVPGADLAQAREIAGTVPASLLAVLKAELEQNGPEGAIGACRDKAPAMARAASEKTGWQVRRASLRNRSPKGVPDAWERSVLMRFDASAAAGAEPATLEVHELVNEDGKTWVRYAKALPTQTLCVQCHGATDKLSDPVKARLQTLYPDDHATGYEPGQIRGALFLRKPLN